MYSGLGPMNRRYTRTAVVLGVLSSVVFSGTILAAGPRHGGGRGGDGRRSGPVRTVGPERVPEFPLRMALPPIPGTVPALPAALRSRRMIPFGRLAGANGFAVSPLWSSEAYAH